MIHRHPSRIRLAAWFDGEAERTIGDHVRHCARCRSYVQSLGVIRAAVRGEEPAPEFTRHRRPTVVVAIAASFAVLVAFSAAWAGPFHERFQGVLSLLSGGVTTHHVAASSRPSPRLRVRSSTAAVTPPVSHAAHETTGVDGVPPVDHRVVAEPPSPVAPALPALRLAVLVPTTGPDAAEGSDVVKAVRTVVSAANKEGGVWGRRIRFSAVPDNGHAPKGTRGAVFVGGFGAARGASWLLPADPTARGTGVVSGEVSPRAAGVVLGRDLKRQGLSGPVGVILGAGPDAAFASGLAEVVPVKKVKAQPGAPCAAEVLAFRQQGVSALAVAGPPDLQARCANAAAGQVWLPNGGLLLPPSAAYAGLQALPSVQGARTVLGFPWPSSDDPGAARFRAAVPGVWSYRALVSFAAAELAIQVSRADAALSARLVRTGAWRSDLYSLAHGTAADPKIVVASWQGWMPQSSGASPSPQPSPTPTGNPLTWVPKPA